MVRVLPWPAPGEQGYINAHYRGPNFRGMGGRAFKDLDFFMDYAIVWGNSNPSYVTDMYFCLSQQAETDGVTNNGRVKAARSAKDATLLKAIWADVDGYKDYPDKMTALKAINKFVKDAALPSPTALVDSGGGWHVYWISDKPLTRDEWRSYANGLWELIQKHGLKADNVTTDAARILRVPGTFNHKQLPPKPVALKWLVPHDLDFAAVMPKSMAPVALPCGSKAAKELPFNPALFPPRMDTGPANGPNDGMLGANCQRPDIELDPLTVLADCPHFSEAAQTGGKDHSQGLWMLTVLASTWFEDGRKIAHTLSQGYKTYSTEETDAMFDRKVADREANGLGWPSCKAFEKDGCKQCATCKHFGKIKSPLNLAHPPQTPPAEPSFGDPTLSLWDRHSPSTYSARRWPSSWTQNIAPWAPIRQQSQWRR